MVTSVRLLVEIMFAAALFINALIFIPQAFHITRKKSAKGLSLVTFSGILFCQLAMLLHGLMIKDLLFTLGYTVSLLSCGLVVLLMFRYR